MVFHAKALAQHALDALLPHRRALDELRAQWGRPGEKCEPFADCWFELTRGAAPCVDDKTWADLELPRVFEHLDTTATPLGSQALYRQLRVYVDDPAELVARHALHMRLRDDKPLRERLQRLLLRLRAPVHAHIAETLFGTAPASPPRRWLFGLWGVLALLPLAGLLLHGWSAWWWIAALLVNSMLVYRLSWQQMREMERVDACLQLAGVADALAAVREGAPALPPLERLHAERGQRDAARRPLWLLRACKQEGVSWFMPWLNLLCLLELNLHLWTVDRFFRQRERLRASFAAVAQLDTAIALASALALYPRHCRPQLVATRTLDIADGRHPLLPDGVANSLRLDGQGVLVTGSNMAGKTTFVKMLAINAILGRTAGFCLATRAVLPALPVRAAIHGMHSVASGKSHYFAEVEAIRGFLAAGAPSGGLFVLDEPFSGTNTVERVAIGAAVLRARGARAAAGHHPRRGAASDAGRAVPARPFPGGPRRGGLLRLPLAPRPGHRTQRDPPAGAHGFSGAHRGGHDGRRAGESRVIVDARPFPLSAHRVRRVAGVEMGGLCRSLIRQCLPPCFATLRAMGP